MKADGEFESNEVVAADDKKDAYHAPTQEEVRAQLETSVTLTKTVG